MFARRAERCSSSEVDPARLGSPKSRPRNEHQFSRPGATSGRKHLPVPYDAPVSAFEAIAGDYPVFRIDPAV